LTTTATFITRGVWGFSPRSNADLPDMAGTGVAYVIDLRATGTAFTELQANDARLTYRAAPQDGSDTARARAVELLEVVAGARGSVLVLFDVMSIDGVAAIVRRVGYVDDEVEQIIAMLLDDQLVDRLASCT
jgi:hypothetical protein